MQTPKIKPTKIRFHVRIFADTQCPFRSGKYGQPKFSLRLPASPLFRINKDATATAKCRVKVYAVLVGSVDPEQRFNRLLPFIRRPSATEFTHRFRARERKVRRGSCVSARQSVWPSSWPWSRVLLIARK